MIRLTRLNGQEFVLNCELIKFIEETPDTVVTLINSDKVVIVEKADDVVKRCIQYHQTVRAFQLP